MEKWKKRAVDFLTSLAFGGREDLAVVPYYPQKTGINMPEKPFFSRSTPERHGISSKRIYNMLCELENEPMANIHTIMVLCGGEVISECSADGYSSDARHISHSMAKTVCGMLIGTLIDEGSLSLDNRVVDFFPEIEYRAKKFPSVTVGHLLSMTSGVDFAEAGVVTDNKWTETFFASSIRFAPGSRFAYNSMNSYILARIAERVSGRSFGELVEKRIFLPLEINNYLWEKGPEGTEKGGWGLYLSAESWAKLGFMIASGGVFRGRRILSDEWVKHLSEMKASAVEWDKNFDYAYHAWVLRGGNEILFNGMLGQNVWICPNNDIIVVMLAGNNEIFGASPALQIVRKHLGGRICDRLSRRDIILLREKESTFYYNRKWVRPKERAKGLLYRLGIKPGQDVANGWKDILGRYEFSDNSVGMMPLIVRVMQNNLRSSLKEMRFRIDDNQLYLDYREGGDVYSLKIGLYGYESNILFVRGEPYIVKAMGEAVVLQNGEVEYRIQLIPNETASVRRLVIQKKSDRIVLTLSELPNNRMVENLLEHYAKTNKSLAFGIDLIERRLGEGAVNDMIKNSFNPTVMGVDVSLEDYEKIIDEENKRIAEQMQKGRAIQSLVDRFFSENKEEKESKNPAGFDQIVRKSVSNFLYKISGKHQKNEQNDN